MAQTRKRTRGNRLIKSSMTGGFPWPWTKKHAALRNVITTTGQPTRPQVTQKQTTSKSRGLLSGLKRVPQMISNKFNYIAKFKSDFKYIAAGGDIYKNINYFILNNNERLLEKANTVIGTAKLIDNSSEILREILKFPFVKSLFDTGKLGFIIDAEQGRRVRYTGIFGEQKLGNTLNSPNIQPSLRIFLYSPSTIPEKVIENKPPNTPIDTNKIVSDFRNKLKSISEYSPYFIDETLNLSPMPYIFPNKDDKKNVIDDINVMIDKIIIENQRKYYENSKNPIGSLNDVNQLFGVDSLIYLSSDGNQKIKTENNYFSEFKKNYPKLISMLYKDDSNKYYILTGDGKTIPASEYKQDAESILLVCVINHVQQTKPSSELPRTNAKHNHNHPLLNNNKQNKKNSHKTQNTIPANLPSKIRQLPKLTKHQPLEPANNTSAPFNPQLGPSPESIL